VAAAESYSQVLYFMSGLLLVGLVANCWLSPVDARYHHQEMPPPSPPL
jgi:hypothetical protein